MVTPTTKTVTTFRAYEPGTFTPRGYMQFTTFGEGNGVYSGKTYVYVSYARCGATQVPVEGSEKYQRAFWESVCPCEVRMERS